MADRINLNRLKNINFSSVKEGAKKTAALTLLLSTVACSSYQGDYSEFSCCVIPLCAYGLLCALAIIPNVIENRNRPKSPKSGSGGDIPEQLGRGPHPNDGY